MTGRLTLVVAAAGYGKTTLAAQVSSVDDRPAAWLQLDPGDNDPVVFLEYLFASLGRVLPGFSLSVRTSCPPMVLTYGPQRLGEQAK